jgi:hypothetical protein
MEDPGPPYPEPTNVPPTLTTIRLRQYLAQAGHLVVQSQQLTPDPTNAAALAQLSGQLTATYNAISADLHTLTPVTPPPPPPTADD